MVVGAKPQPPHLRIPSRMHTFFITLLLSPLGSSMKKSFAFGEAVGLTPFGPRDPAARRGETAPCCLSAVRLASTQPSVAERGRNSRRREAFAPRLLQNLTPPPA